MKLTKLKSIVWIGSSLEDLKNFPRQVQKEVGFALYRAQIGKQHKNCKSLKGFSGVIEIVSSYDTDAYRTIYATKLGEKIYVLHAFKKKSKRGIKTPDSEIELIKKRLQRAKDLAKENNNE